MEVSDTRRENAQRLKAAVLGTSASSAEDWATTGERDHKGAGKGKEKPEEERAKERTSEGRAALEKGKILGKVECRAGRAKESQKEDTMAACSMARAIGGTRRREREVGESGQ